MFNLYCEEELEKTKREIFVTGSLADVKENFQVCLDLNLILLTVTTDCFIVICFCYFIYKLDFYFM